jgi:hypothetical protein
MIEGTGRRIQKEIMQIVFGEQKVLKGLSGSGFSFQK